MRKIFSISARLGRGRSRGCAFPRAGTDLITGAGFGSGFATALAVKALAGSSAPDFFTSLRTLVSLMLLCFAARRNADPLNHTKNAQNELRGNWCGFVARVLIQPVTRLKSRFSKWFDTLRPSLDDRAPSPLRP